MQKKDRVEILLEDVGVKYDTILEYVADIPDMKRRLNSIEAKVDILQTDMTLVKVAVTDHSRRISTLERRVF